jgi:hypothetical protein
MNTSAGAIWLYEPESTTLRIVVARGWFSHLSLRPKGATEGIGGIVFTTGKPYYTHDFAHDENSRQSIRKNIPEGWGGACIPIYTTTERVGIFYLGVPSDRELKEEEKHLLSNLAEIAGNAIYRMRLHAQSEMHVHRLNALHNFDLAISSSLDLRLTLDDLLNRVRVQGGYLFECVQEVDALLFGQGKEASLYERKQAVVERFMERGERIEQIHSCLERRDLAAPIRLGFGDVDKFRRVLP